MESELKDLNSNSAYDKENHMLLKTETNAAASLEELDRKFAPFARRDMYGPMGCGPLPVKEKLLLGMSMMTLLPIRVVLAMSILVFYYLICRVCTLFSAPNRDEEDEGEEEGMVQEDYAHMGGWRRAVIVRCGRLLSRVMLFVLGFYWIHETHRDTTIDANPKTTPENSGKDETEDPERPGAIISNHMSYLDILYHMSSSFPSFVAKRSVANLPLVGLISKCLGCVFVQREGKSPNFRGVVTERVREAHQNNSAPIMILFPGTTTKGDYLLPFKTGAFLARTPVVPVILRYPYRRFSLAWDSTSGVRHVLLLCQFVNHIEVIHLPVYNPSQQEKNDPKLYAENVWRLMASEGNLILSDMGLAEKRIYLAALNGSNNPPIVFHHKND